jgi:hypothetical protein
MQLLSRIGVVLAAAVLTRGLVGCGNGDAHPSTLPFDDAAGATHVPTFVSEAGLDADASDVSDAGDASDASADVIDAPDAADAIDATDTLDVADTPDVMVTPIDPAVCPMFTLGAPVMQNQIARDPPVAAGGGIAPGRYVLTATTVFTGIGGATGPSGQSEAAEIDFDGTHFQLQTASPISDGGLAVVASAGTYDLGDAGLALQLTSVCGPTNPTYGYSNIAGSLRLILGMVTLDFAKM